MLSVTVCDRRHAGNPGNRVVDTRCCTSIAPGFAADCGLGEPSRLETRLLRRFTLARNARVGLYRAEISDY
jgi:hypothetical protein